MKVRTKLLSILTLMITILGLVGFSGVYFLDKTTTQSKNTIALTNQGSTLVASVEFNSDYMVHMMHHFLEGNGINDNSTLIKYSNARTLAFENLTQLAGLNILNIQPIAENMTNILSNITKILEEKDYGLFDQYLESRNLSSVVHSLFPIIIANLDTFISNETNQTILSAAYHTQYHFDHAIHMMHHHIENTLTNTLTNYNNDINQTLSSIQILQYTNQGNDAIALYSLILNNIILINNYINNSEAGVFYYNDQINLKADSVHEYYALFVKQVEQLNLQFGIIIEENEAEITSAMNQQLLTTYFLIGIAFLIVIVVFPIINRSITRPLNHLKNSFKLLAKGDLRVDPFTSIGKDEFGEISINFNELLGFNKNIVSKLQRLSDDLASAAEELSSSAEEVSTASESIASTQQQISKGSMDQVTAVNSTNKKITELTQNIRDIKIHISKINEISDFVINIAGQTNMLALNAAIEAARAGEAGKGFNVVADQVRRLAGDSKNAVSNTNQILEEINSQMNNQEKNASIISTDISNITNVAEGAAAITEEISAAAEEQASTLTNISSASQKLLSIAEDLNHEVKKFVVSG